MTLEEIRRLVIIAMFSDDVLFEKLVFKGGNALELLYGIGARSSLDLDFSIEQDFSDPDDIKRRMFSALRDRLESNALVMFDEQIERKFPKREPAVTLGYQVTFKIIGKEHAENIGRMHSNDDRRIERMRIESMVVGPAQQRSFKIDISTDEFCSTKRQIDLDDYAVCVYTLEMIAIEKLRAICQQMNEYSLRLHPAPRARDFYDIHSIVSAIDMNFSEAENVELLRNIFAAKRVPLSLLKKIPEYRDFHRPDWPAVVDSVAVRLNDFDYYYDFVIQIVQLLESLGIVDSPG